MATKSEINEAKKEQLIEWADALYEAPADGWDAQTVDQLRDLLKNDPEFVTEPQTQGDPDEPEDAEGDAAAPPIDRPNPSTDLYSGKIRGPRT